MRTTRDDSVLKSLRVKRSRVQIPAARPRKVQNAGLEVDVLPAKTSKLVAAQPSREQHGPGGSEAVVPGRLEEASSLLIRSGRHDLGRHSKTGDADERVTPEQTDRHRHCPIGSGLEHLDREPHQSPAP